MKNLVLIVVACLFVTSCATIKVTTDYDTSASFDSYKTFAFSEEAMTLDINELNRNRLLAAVEDQMGQKGFTKSESPEILIDMNIVSKTIQTATANTTNSGGYYGSGYRYGYGGGFSTTTINYDSYEEGTLFIDMIDMKKNQLVWQGRGIATLDPNASTDKRESRIKTAVEKIFSKYPPETK